jgi:hypothetical protein
MLVTNLLLFLNLLCAGILAGIEIAIHYGLTGPAELLAETPQIRLRQALILRLRWLVPAFFMPTALTAIALMILQYTSSGMLLRMLGTLCVLIWIFVRFIATVRINSATLEWDADAPPKDWKRQITDAERFHIVGTWAAIMIFVLFLIAALASKTIT